MSSVTIYRCKDCGRYLGFIEHFSHDHRDFQNDIPQTALRSCRLCCPETGDRSPEGGDGLGNDGAIADSDTGVRFS